MGAERMKAVPRRYAPLVLPVRLHYEGHGAVVIDQAGQEIHFMDRSAATIVSAMLNELHDLRQASDAALRDATATNAW